MSAHRFQLLIFDWDGTLADSESLIVIGMQNAIRDLNLQAREDAEIGQLIGLSLQEGMRRLYPELDTAALIRLLTSYRKGFVVDGRREAPLFAGARAALQRLSAGGHRLAVATGKTRAGLDRSLRTHRDLATPFAATRTADETANKPDPRMLLELLEDAGVPAERALMIGDTEYDAAMASAIGMPMLGVTCGVHAPERILGAGAMALIETVAALPDWLCAPDAGR